MPGPGPGPKRFRLSDSGSLGCKYLKVCIVWGKDSVGERGSCGLGSRQREKKTLKSVPKCAVRHPLWRRTQGFLSVSDFSLR